MIRYMILGVVQGFTEFLPVSSSGHLVLFQNLLGIEKEVVFLDVVLHLGTLCSLFVYFRTDLFVLFSNCVSAVIDIVFRRRLAYVLRYNDKFRLCIYVALTALITGSIALIGKDFFESLFASTSTLAVAFFITGLVLLLTKQYNFGQRYLRHILTRDTILIGIVQALAIIPGISRSGITISALCLRNVENESAFKFSFFVSMPLILGAFMVKLQDVSSVERATPLIYLIAGFVMAFVGGLIALGLLRKIILRQNFYKFSYYCFAMGLLLLVLKIKHIM